MNIRILLRIILLLSFMISIPGGTNQYALGQSDDVLLPPDEIATLVQEFKEDQRGPYQSIRWFCPDGTIMPIGQRCPMPGGVQHALPKDVVLRLADEQHLFLGQVLAGVSFDELQDKVNDHSRLKQYMIDHYLRRIDNGWILRKAQYYRGAIQAEDETAWGTELLRHILGQDDMIKSKFYLTREFVRDLPHADQHTDRMQQVRAISQQIANELPSFQEIRIKLHGSPEKEDIRLVRQFRRENPQLVSGNIQQQFNRLEDEMEVAFQPEDYSDIRRYQYKLLPAAAAYDDIAAFMKKYASGNRNVDIAEKSSDIVDLMVTLRREVLNINSSNARLTFMDLSLALETILYTEIGEWEPETIREALRKNYVLAKAAAGLGQIELWEWDRLEPQLRVPESVSNLQLADFIAMSDAARRVTEWGAMMVRITYISEVERFGAFEPMAYSFIDDRIRISPLLRLGLSATAVSDIIAEYTGADNQIMDIRNTGQVRGLNPGYAVGELQVVQGSPENISFNSNKIYVLSIPPADLKPVAGIATVSEGNPVSHVQLLARNLGIPNAVLNQDLINQLSRYSGQEIFLAVSPGGTVVMKRADDMTREERALIAVKERSADRLSVPVNDLNLREKDLISLDNVRADDSGILCGPKAANLGELKHMFPQNVVEGVVVPFGVFRDHMDQPMPDTDGSYWDFLQQIFQVAEALRDSRIEEQIIEVTVLNLLASLRESIQTMDFLPGFEQDLNRAFRNYMGRDLGQLPVFIRSDTNMEDLEEFTGAGLNLTVFNVISRQKILQGIRDVWASPYSERSYLWRQKYLDNPENVYPSILIIPSVNVDKSGVLITSGMAAGDADDMTVSFNRGVAGGVMGQMSESYLLTHPNQGTVLISPAREHEYLAIPASGGTVRLPTDLDEPILLDRDLAEIRKLTAEVRKTLPETTGDKNAGPYDVELGFLNNKLWLFQVRPYVENSAAKSSSYLQSLDPVIPDDVTVNLNENI